MAVNDNDLFSNLDDYDPTAKKLPVPVAGILDEPGNWQFLNEEWRGIIFGVVRRLLWSDAWVEDEAEFDRASTAIRDWFAQSAGRYEVVLCDSIAECISTSDAVQNSLAQGLNDSGSLAPMGGLNLPRLSDEVQGENLLSPESPCNNDNVFGMAKTITWAIHRATTEVFQAIEVLTNPVELAAELSDNIPGVGIAGSGLDVISWIQDSAYENYLLAWSDIIWDRLACQVYCRIKDNGDCSLSFKDLVEIYALPFADIPPAGSTLTAMLDYIINIPVDLTETFVKACDLFGLVLMQYGGKFGQLALGVHSLKTVLALAANDTDPDWSILCTDCPDLLERLAGAGNADMTALPFGGAPASVYNIVEDSYIGGVVPGNGASLMHVQYDLGTVYASITSITFRMRIHRTQGAGGNNIYGIDIDGVRQQDYIIPDSDLTEHEVIFSWSGNVSGQVVEVLGGVFGTVPEPAKSDTLEVIVSAI